MAKLLVYRIKFLGRFGSGPNTTVLLASDDNEALAMASMLARLQIRGDVWQNTRHVDRVSWWRVEEIYSESSTREMPNVCKRKVGETSDNHRQLSVVVQSELEYEMAPEESR